MTKSMFGRVCAILQTLPSQAKWDDAIAIVYLNAMREWSDEVVGAIMEHVQYHCEYRPTIAELRKIAIKLFDPMLSPESIYEDVRKVLIMVAPHERTKVVEAKVANGSMKEAVVRVVKECGGWARLSSMDAQEVRKQVFAAVPVVYQSLDFDHVFVTPAECPALEAGRRAVGAIEE